MTSRPTTTKSPGIECGSAVHLGVHEVTRPFPPVCGRAGYQTEAEKDGKGGAAGTEETKKLEQTLLRYDLAEPRVEQTDVHPVVNVSWNDTRPSPVVES